MQNWICSGWMGLRIPMATFASFRHPYRLQRLARGIGLGSTVPPRLAQLCSTEVASVTWPESTGFSGPDNIWQHKHICATLPSQCMMRVGQHSWNTCGHWNGILAEYHFWATKAKDLVELLKVIGSHDEIQKAKDKYSI